jgi:hypothetical protein
VASKTDRKGICYIADFNINALPFFLQTRK